MKKALIILIVVLSQTVPAVAQHELIDPKTREYTPRGIVASMIAGAQMSEMRCGTKGQITAALAKSESTGHAVQPQ